MHSNVSMVNCDFEYVFLSNYYCLILMAFVAFPFRELILSNSCEYRKRISSNVKDRQRKTVIDLVRYLLITFLCIFSKTTYSHLKNSNRLQIFRSIKCLRSIQKDRQSRFTFEILLDFPKNIYQTFAKLKVLQKR